MDKETTATVVSVIPLLCLGMRIPFGDFYCPHIIKVKYTAEEKDYCKWLWIGRHDSPPAKGSSLKAVYCADDPRKATFY